MTTTPTISSDVLEALLSPQRNVREAAEGFLHSLSAEDRCRALLLCHTATHAPAHLRCVLLRQSILKVTDTDLLESLVPPLLEEAARCTDDAMQVRLQDAMAQAIGGLSMLQADAQATSAMELVLQANANHAMAGSLPALRLLVSLAEQAPRALSQCALSSLPQLVSTVLQRLALIPTASTPTVLSVLLQLVVSSAMAATVPPDQPLPTLRLKRDPSQHHAATLTHMGMTCLLPLLQSKDWTLDHAATREQLLDAAESMPSLWGHAQVWEATMRSCLDFATRRSDSSIHPDQAGDVVQSRLQMLDAMACLLDGATAARTRLDTDARHSLGAPVVEGLMGILCRDHVRRDSAIDGSDDDEEEQLLYASAVLEQWIIGLADPVVPYVMQHVETRLGLVEPRSQQGALLALQSLLEAVPARFQPYLGAAMEAALTLGQHHVDQHVQYHAIRLIGALCESRREGNAVEFHAMAGRILQTLAVAAQSSSTKIASMACSAMVAYTRPVAQEMDVDKLVLPYLSDILSALMGGPLSPSQFRPNVDTVDVKVAAMAAVACFAEAAEEAFIPFYPHVMPVLWNYVNASANGSHVYELTRLKGSALETATIVIQALGEDNIPLFGSDAEAIMNLAVSVLTQTTPDDVTAGMPLDELLSACARIASVMKERFAPFLGVVFPPMLHRATDASGDIEISDCTDANAIPSKLEVDEVGGTESLTVALPGRGLTNLTINTSKIQDKAQAGRAIYELASSLGAAFGPYAKATLDAFLGLVAYKYSTDVRATASQTLAAAFEAACACGEESSCMDLPSEYLPVVAKALVHGLAAEDDLNLETKFAFAEAISQVFFSVFSRRSAAGVSLLRHFTLDDVSHVTKQCIAALVASLERRNQITAERSKDHDGLSEEELEELSNVLAKEDELLTPLTDSIGYMLKLNRESFLPMFETTVAPVLGPYLQSTTDLSAKLAAVCLFDDCVEFCGMPAASKYAPVLMEGALSGLDDATNGGNMDLKRASIYGIAQVARNAPHQIHAHHLKRIIPTLWSIVAQSRDDYEENPGVYENAVSALGSLVLFGAAPAHGSIKEDLAVDILLRNLPLREDCDEAKVCSTGFCELIENGSIPLAMECDSILRVIGDTLALVNDGEELADPQTIARFVGILVRLQQVVPGDRMHQSFDRLSGEAQEAINASMNRHQHMFTNVVTPEK